MPILNREDLTELIKQDATVCISLLMPTHRTGREQQQDLIRFKNLCAETREQLEALGTPTDAIRELLAPVEAIKQDSDFWRQRQDGLAIFRAQDFIRPYQLPLRLETSVNIGSRFYVRPLIQLLHGNSRFFVLSLTQEGAQLYESNRFSIRELDLGVAPSKESRREREHGHPDTPTLQFHTQSSPSQRGKRTVLYHGQASDADVTKQAIIKHFQAVDRAVSKILQDERAASGTGLCWLFGFTVRDRQFVPSSDCGKDTGKSCYVE